MSEFSVSYRIRPRGGVISTENPEISFNFLIDSFSFFIRLGVVGCGEGKVIIKEFSQFFGKC